jgi:2-polyprenyl-3-methyl-5-hydroxy-6-metoxy-1,4-benzoquinol methylase
MTIEAWPENGLEYLGKCPICGNAGRTLLHDGLYDRLFGAPGLWTMYRCSHCKSGYLDPRPNQETVGLAYANYVTHEPQRPIPTQAIKLARLKLRNGYLNRKFGYHESPSWRCGYWIMRLMPFPIRGEWDHRARHLRIPEFGTNRLLDVGCGNGNFLRDARSAGWDVQGTDLDPVAVETARRLGISVWEGRYDTAPFDPSSFDVITTHQVIEHVPDPLIFLRTLFNWLKPGGLLWIGTPNLDCPIHERFGEFYGNLHPPQHTVMLNQTSLINLTQSAGFCKQKFLRRGLHDYNQTLGSAALERGLTGQVVYKGVKHAPLQDRLLGLINELRAWIDPAACSDLVLICEKPHA